MRHLRALLLAPFSLLPTATAQEDPATAQEPPPQQASSGETSATPTGDAPAPAQSVETLARSVRRSAVVIRHGGRAGGSGGTGSGFVISKEGHIATCAHVIGESRPLTVHFDDGSEYKVTAIHAWDAKLDLAVLKIDETNLPQEVGRDTEAISFVKGCYLGQETVARIDALGHVNRMLVGVELAGGEMHPGDEFLVEQKPVGRLTSVAVSPRTGKAIGLATVKRGFHECGTVLSSAHGTVEVCRSPAQ